VPVTIALVAINVLAFAAAVASGVPVLQPAPDQLARWGANIGPLTADGQPWRTVTSVFVHFGLLHLLINVVALADLGRIAERLFGSAALAFIALASGAIGAATSVAWNPWVASAGASGAVFGILGALLAYCVQPATRVPPSLLRTQWVLFAAFAAFTVVAGLTGTGIDHAAHLGGFIAGAALGAVLARPLGSPRTPLRSALAAGLAVAAFAAAMATWRNVGPAYAEEQRFIAAAREHLEGEGARVADLRESFRRWRAGDISAAAHAQALTAYARLLAATADRLDGYRLAADSPAAPRFAQETFSSVLRLRARGIERRAYAVARGSQSAATEADRLLAEADAMWERAACGAQRSPLLRCASKRTPPEP
jgi:rhomboid protease GluP